MNSEQQKLYSYLGKSLVNTFKECKVIIAGGAITSLFCNRDINDIDVYVRTQDDLVKIISYLYEENGWVVSHTKKATLFKYNEKLIQVIHIRCFNDIQDIFNSFDFTVCMGAYDFSTEQFVFDQRFLKHNAQRLLEFNPKTSFPIMSLLRVQKYEKKGYKISKTEFLKVILTCMDMNITSYDELKEQLGGMYGLDMSKLFDESKEFSLESAVEQLSNLYLNEDYFKEPTKLDFDDVDDILDNILGKPKEYFVINDENYTVKPSGVIRKVEVLSDNATEVDIQSIIKGNKLYKFVRKRRDNTYVSQYHSDFEYKLGEVVVAKGDYGYCAGLYCGLLSNVDEFGYGGYSDSVLIELEINPEDIIEINDYVFRVKKAKFTREVPKEEYEEEGI